MTDLFHQSDPEIGSHDDEPAPASRRSDSRNRSRKRQAKRRAQRRRTIFTFVAMVVALVLLVGGGWMLLRPLLSSDGSSGADATLTDYTGAGSGSVEVVVNEGDSGAAIGETLVAADVVASVDAFVGAYSVNADASSIQPGTYALPMQIPAAEAVAALLDSANRLDGLTIPEGWRATQIYQRIAEVLEVDVADVEAAVEEVDLPEEANGAIEGWLYPTTYNPGSDPTPTSVLQAMVDNTVQALEDADVPRDRWNDVIILASIVEKEVIFDDDRAAVARVFLNRLDANLCPDTLGRLQSDTTLVYELNKPHDEITSTEWETATPYNTRVNEGLPPTAISSPSASSIQAVMNPAEGDWCYFITVNLDTGDTKFTADYHEFLEFKQEYQEWLESQG